MPNPSVGHVTPLLERASARGLELAEFGAFGAKSASQGCSNYGFGKLKQALNTKQQTSYSEPSQPSACSLFSKISSKHLLIQTVQTPHPRLLPCRWKLHKSFGPHLPQLSGGPLVLMQLCEVQWRHPVGPLVRIHPLLKQELADLANQVVSWATFAAWFVDFVASFQIGGRKASEVEKQMTLETCLIEKPILREVGTNPDTKKHFQPDLWLSIYLIKQKIWLLTNSLLTPKKTNYSNYSNYSPKAHLHMTILRCSHERRPATRGRLRQECPGLDEALHHWALSTLRSLRIFQKAINCFWIFWCGAWNGLCWLCLCLVGWWFDGCREAFWRGKHAGSCKYEANKEEKQRETKEKEMMSEVGSWMCRATLRISRGES